MLAVDKMLAATDKSKAMEPPKVIYKLTQPLRAKKPAVEGLILPRDANFKGIRVTFTKIAMGGYETDVHEDGKLLVSGMKIMRNVDSMPVQTRCGTVAFTLATAKPGDRIELKALG